MAATGMNMMLKAMGIDPETIMESVEGFKAVILSAVDEVRNNQKVIDSKLDLILFELQSKKDNSGSDVYGSDQPLRITEATGPEFQIQNSASEGDTQNGRE